MRKPPVVEIHKPVRRGDRWVAHASVRLPHGEVLKFAASASETLVGRLAQHWKGMVGSHVSLTSDGIAFGAVADHPKTVRALTQARAAQAVGKIASRAAAHPYTLARTPLGGQARGTDFDAAVRLARQLGGIAGARLRARAIARARRLKSLAAKGDQKAREALRLIALARRGLALLMAARKGSPAAKQAIARIQRDARKSVPKALEALAVLRSLRRFAGLISKGLRLGKGNIWSAASTASSSSGEVVEEVEKSDAGTPAALADVIEEIAPDETIEEVEPVRGASTMSPIIVPEYDAHGDEDEEEWADVAIGAVYATRPTERRLSSHAMRLLSLFERIRSARMPTTTRVEFGFDLGSVARSAASYAPAPLHSLASSGLATAGGALGQVNELRTKAEAIRAQIPLFASNPSLAFMVPRMIEDATAAEREMRALASRATAATAKIAPTTSQGIFRAIAAQRPGSAPAIFGVPSFASSALLASGFNPIPAPHF